MTVEYASVSSQFTRLSRAHKEAMALFLPSDAGQPPHRRVKNSLVGGGARLRRVQRRRPRRRRILLDGADCQVQSLLTAGAAAILCRHERYRFPSAAQSPNARTARAQTQPVRVAEFVGFEERAIAIPRQHTMLLQRPASSNEHGVHFLSPQRSAPCCSRSSRCSWLPESLRLPFGTSTRRCWKPPRRRGGPANKQRSLV